jgi:glutathione S-transferase
MELRLITIPVSHYCEKARWALERARIPYREVRHVQFVHYASTLLHARSLFAPVLLTPEGPITDSTEILRWVDRQSSPESKLFPEEASISARVAEWEELFDRTVGVETRRWMYHVGFEQLGGDRMIALAAQGVPAWECAAMKVVLPIGIAYLRWRLAVGAETVTRGLDVLHDVFERVGRELADGRRYLVGDRFTAADLTFASLSVFVLMPPEYGVRLPELSELPPPMRKVVDSFRDTPAGRYALRLFEHDR